uniref:Putative transmembrane protein n=1 Tax=Serpentovirinae sp. TaxID=2661817 RepID=A0A5P9K4S7_9NIDO|nr:putative transmembrane protein [Serpentovirinae sp.]
MSFSVSDNDHDVQIYQTGTKASKIKCLLTLWFLSLVSLTNAQQVQDTVELKVNHKINACTRIPVIVTDRENLVHELTIKINNPSCNDNGLGVYQLDSFRFSDGLYEFLVSNQLPDGENYSPRSCSLSVNSSHVFIVCFNQPFNRNDNNLVDFNKGILTKCNATIFVYDVIFWQLRQFHFKLEENYCATSASQDAFVECRYGTFLATSSYSHGKQSGVKGTFVYIFDQHLKMLTKIQASTYYGEANIQSMGNCAFKLRIRSSGDKKSPFLTEVTLSYNGSTLTVSSNTDSEWHTPFNSDGWVFKYPFVYPSTLKSSFGTANFPAYAPVDYGRYPGESVIFEKSYFGITTNFSNTNGRFVPMFVYKINEKIKSEKIFGFSHIAYANGVYFKDRVLLLIETDSCQDTGLFPCVKRVMLDLLNRPILRMEQVINTTLDSINGTTSQVRVASKPEISALAIVIVNLCIVTLGLCAWVITKLFLRYKFRPFKWLIWMKSPFNRPMKS